MAGEQKELINDRPRMLSEAFEKGRVAVDLGLPRESPFTAADLTAEFHRGYDLGRKRDGIADKPWGGKGWAGPESRGGEKCAHPYIAALRLRLRGVLGA